MSVIAQDFLKSAETLLNNPDSQEIDFRNSISRSYYAVYHVSKSIADKLPIPQGDKMGSHEKVIEAFKQHSKLPVRGFGYIVEQLKFKRCDADYELNLEIKHSETEEHVDKAKRLLEKLEQFEQSMIAK